MSYCECEKYLLDTHQQGQSENAATAIAKEKTEESYLWEIAIKKISTEQPVNNTPSFLYQALIPEDHTKNIFQPPRV